jgi:transcriptional regulator with XRE-family HTH domain
VTLLDAVAGLDHPGGSIRERRIELGWTQAELSQHSGVPQADISRIENGHLDARWSTVRRLSVALATVATPARRSLANGNRRQPTDVTGRPAWQPSSPVQPISK